MADRIAPIRKTPVEILADLIAGHNDALLAGPEKGKKYLQAIKGRVINSVLSSGVWVGENACIKNSVIMANTSIGRHSVIMNSILDEGVNIGAQCQVGDELGKESLHSGLTVLGKNVKVPSYSHVKLNGDIIHAHKSLPEYYEGWVGENLPAAI